MNKNGFTLIEMLVVLGIVSILLLLSAPLTISTLEKQRDKQFLDVFKFDVLYIQNLASTTKEPITLTFYKDRYEINKHHKKSFIVRQYPNGWELEERPNNSIKFKQNGTFIKPRTFLIASKNTAYQIIFPLGKGRCYIVKK